MIPEFILDDNCPLPVIREFLGGLFGGDGHTTCYSKHNNKFTSIGFSQTRTENKCDSLTNFLNQLSLLLNKFGIKSTIQNKIKKPSSDTEDHYSMCLRVEMSCIPLFEQNIGFRYCYHKSFRLAVVSSYFKCKQKIYEQSDLTVKKYIEYRNNKIKEIPKFEI